MFETVVDSSPKIVKIAPNNNRVCLFIFTHEEGSVSVLRYFFSGVSVSLSAILFFRSIAIAIDDTFGADIGIDYRDTFKKYR